MRLSDYISDPGRRDALASALGTSPDYLYQIATGRRRGRAETVAAIARQTNGVVTVAEIWPDLADALHMRRPARRPRQKISSDGAKAHGVAASRPRRARKTPHVKGSKGGNP